MTDDREDGLGRGEFKPFDIEVEQSLLGALIVDNRKLSVAMADLSSEDFYDGFHARIFERMILFDEDGRSINDVTLASSLKNDPARKDLDIPGYLYSLTVIAGPTADVATCCKIIVEHRERREARDAINSSYQEIYFGEPTARSLLQVVDVADRIAVRSQRERGSGDIRDAVEGLARDVENAAKGGKLAGVSTGMAPLDRLLGGYMPSHLIIVAGRPGMGKSVVACQTASHVGSITEGRERLYDPTVFSLEMGGKENAARMIAELDYDESIAQGRAPLQYSKIMKGRLSDDEFERFVLLGQRLEDFGIKVYDEGKMTMQRIAALARARAQLSPRRPFIIIDNIQIVGENPSARGRLEALTMISGEMKALAKRLDCPVMALSHLSRSVESREDKRPNLSDLRESGSIEQDADEVLFLYRPEYYLRAAVRHARASKSNKLADLEAALFRSEGVLEVLVEKNRSGATGAVELFVDVASNVVRAKKPAPGDGAPAQLRLADPIDGITLEDHEKRTGDR